MTSIPPRLSEALSGRYQLERELGIGGMATVYLAEDLKHDRKVAIKVLKPELAAVLGAERFIVEIKTTAALQHPHILPLFDSGSADGFLYYVMPYIQGETIREKLNRETQFSVDEAVRIAREVADALDYAHRHGVIHRDIKPENLLLHDGRAMVMDFGIALAVSAAAGGRMTETGLSLGTPHYMSPEQATAEKEITGRSDVYSLATVLYEMLAGQPPHLGGSAQQIIMKIITETAPPVTQFRKSVPQNVAAALATALEKLPADRFDTARDFANALSTSTFTVRGGMAVEAALARSRWKQTYAVPLAALSGVLLLLASAGWLRPRATVSEDVVRVPITLPDSAPLLQQFGTLFALTDDGRNVVYVGPGDGDIDLWVRPLDELTATRIPGTSGGDSPFLSSDGQTVAFYRSNPNQLYTVSLRGGPRSTVVSDSLTALGGDFGPDGSIYFSREGGLRRIGAGGGNVEQVTQVHHDHGERDHAWIDVLPNGKGALFTIVRADGNQYDIAVVDLKTHAVRILFRGTYARYSSSGHILFTVADGGLFAIAFDQDAMTTRGNVIPIAANVVHTEDGVAHFSVSRNGTLLYGLEGKASGSDELVWVDRKGKVELIDSTLGPTPGNLSISPDGRRIAVTVFGATAQIWTLDLPHGPAGKLTLDAASNVGPTWSSDGKFVTYVSERQPAGVYRIRADASSNAELVYANPRVRQAVITPDGEWLICHVFATGSSDIIARRLHGDTTTMPIATTPANERNPRISPDGRWLAYTSGELGRTDVYVVPFPAVSQSRVQISLNGGRDPLWSRNGRELFYTVLTGNLVAARVETSPAFKVMERTTLFSREPLGAPAGPSSLDIGLDGSRFVTVRSRDVTRNEKLVLTLNMFADLARSK